MGPWVVPVGGNRSACRDGTRLLEGECNTGVVASNAGQSGVLDGVTRESFEWAF